MGIVLHRDIKHSEIRWENLECKISVQNLLVQVYEHVKQQVNMTRKLIRSLLAMANGRESIGN